VTGGGEQAGAGPPAAGDGAPVEGPAGAGRDDVEATSAPSIDTARFRQVLGYFASGLTIVTGVDLGQPVGLTCQSFTSVSLDPPLVAICPAKSSSSWPRIQRSGAFCANVMAEDQEDICRLFATKGAEKFAGIGWAPGITGSPVLADVLAWVECRITAVHDAGDHSIVVGRVATLHVGEPGRHPLIFYRGGYGRFEA
jgi:flavin reductase (DIM6/NTAB) family NADH-FMN oxidoreductase RutF